LFVASLALSAATARADTIRVATFHTGLAREGPGLLYRDILKGDAQAGLIAGIVAHIAPDILILQDVDFDHGQLALGALAGLFASAGHPMPHHFALQPNAGQATGLDMDGDRRSGTPRDAQGYGRFAGQGGMAVLSRFPIDHGASRDFSALLWRDLPGADPPTIDGAPFPSAQAMEIQRLSSVAHWQVVVTLPGDQVLSLLTWHGTPPVFDGPEDRNGRRNHDETALWLSLLDGALGPPPAAPFVVIGNANLDTVDGDGRNGALMRLLEDPRLSDPRPASLGGVAAARSDGGANLGQSGDPARDTADWRDTDGQPGNLRVSFILPSRDLTVRDSGVFWPAPDDPLRGLLGEEDNAASRHRMVWADLVTDR
jgi:hypothetical protein